MEDPSRFLNELGLTVASHLDSSASAMLDSAHCLVMNYESFLFATSDEMQSFLTDPTRYCGPLTDPVTLQRFIPGPSSPHLTHANRTYYFWSDSSRAMFEMMPEMYALPHHKMRPKADSTASTSG